MTPVLPSLFNPSNDMALAANVRQYLPPKRIQQMEADLADLAQVWEGTRFAGPWGWSLATKQRYRHMDIADDLLPSDEWLAQLRALSSRQFACEYIHHLLADLSSTHPNTSPLLLGHEMHWLQAGKPLAHEMRPSSAVSPLTSSPFPLILKLPWSSSGRGVFVLPPDAPLSTLHSKLSTQTGFLVDRFYADKTLDFAMEFFIHPDESPNHSAGTAPQVEFLGYSVFQASDHGTYGFNYVESQDELLRRIIGEPNGNDGRDGLNGQDGSIGQIEELLDALVAYHKVHLARTSYRGPLGIDMLKTADGHIHPCLEINFRLNMGILALLLHQRLGSHATAQLTPPRPAGFAARVERGKLMITYKAGA